jgi:hypothetical protein
VLDGGDNQATVPPGEYVIEIHVNPPSAPNKKGSCPLGTDTSTGKVRCFQFAERQLRQQRGLCDGDHSESPWPRGFTGRSRGRPTRRPPTRRGRVDTLSIGGLMALDVPAGAPTLFIRKSAEWLRLYVSSEAEV